MKRRLSVWVLIVEIAVIAALHAVKLKQTDKQNPANAPLSAEVQPAAEDAPLLSIYSILQLK